MYVANGFDLSSDEEGSPIVALRKVADTVGEEEEPPPND